MIAIVRHPALVEFTCGRCTKPKKAKLVGTWTQADGTETTICNGCYGNLKSRGERVGDA